MRSRERTADGDGSAALCDSDRDDGEISFSLMRLRKQRNVETLGKRQALIYI